MPMPERREVASRFWASLEAKKIRPIDVAVKNFSPQQAVEFVRACEVIYWKVVQIGPEVIFIPERGAGPLAWAIREFEDEEVRRRGHQRGVYDIVYLPIGTNTDIVSGRKKGINNGDKRRVIQSQLDMLGRTREAQLAYEHWQETTPPAPRPLSKVVLIDEAQTGSTITDASRILHEELQKQNQYVVLHVIPAIDNRRQRERDKRFIYLVGKGITGRPASTENMPLICIDRPTMLNYILRPADVEDPHGQLVMLKVLQNMNAQVFIRNLIFAVKHSDVLAVALNHLERNREPIESQTDTRRLYNWILDMITEPKSYKSKAEEVDILDWLTQILKTIESNGIT